MNVQIDNKKMWESYRKELSLQGELHCVAAIDDALEGQGLKYDADSGEIVSIDPEVARAKYKMQDQPIHQDLVDIFPELAESNDEKIRRELIDYLKASKYVTARSERESEKWIAYLENQKDTYKDTHKDIEQKPVEWSEEDETMLALLHNCIGHYYADDIIKKEQQLKLEDWLKSLRPQKQWKPTEEQIRAFEWAYKSSKIEEGSQYDINCKDLLEQLKAL